MPSSRGSSKPRDPTQVSHIAGGFFFYHLSHQGSPRILEWVAYPFSRGSSLPRNQTGVSCISGRFFTSWATRETHSIYTAAKSLQSCPTLCDLMDCSPPGSSVHGESPGKNTGVGCHAFLQGIFSTQGFNPGLPHCKWLLYHLSHQGSPVIICMPCLI